MFHMRRALGFFSLGISFYLGSGLLMAQGLPVAPAQSTPTSLSPNIIESNGDLNGSRRYCVVAGRVTSILGDPIPGATVRISPVLFNQYRFFKTDASGEFQTFYPMTILHLEAGYFSDFKVWLTIKKRGFQTAHELIDYSNCAKPARVLPFTLRPEHQDPALLSQQHLLAGLLPGLRSLGPSDGLSAGSEKKYSKGVVQFVDKGRPDRALSNFSDVARRNPKCAKCQTMLALAELDSGNWDGAVRRVNSAIHLTNNNKTGGSPEALVLAGVMESWMHNPQSATNYLIVANHFEPKNSLVLQELGRAYLQLQKYELADAYLERSLAAGAAPEARLLRVQALLGENRLEEANKEMDRYLNGREIKRMPLEARKAWAEVQEREQIQTLYTRPPQAKKKVKTFKLIDYLHDPGLKLKGLEPAKSQDDLQHILTAVGQNVSALFRGFQDSTSLETVRREQLRHDGKVSGKVDEKFRYLFMMSDGPGAPSFTEYRQNINPGKQPQDGLKGYMLTSGFTSAALIFHPAYQSGSHFRYLGRQMVDGHETYVVAFAQIPTKAKLVGSFISDGNSVPTLEQGLAWIDTQNYRIVRLRTDLLQPIAGLQLRELTTRIDYQEVHFKQLGQGLWLPKDVTVTVDWRGKMLRNLHRYSDFKLFNVQASGRIGKLKTSKVPAVPQPPRQ